MAFVIALSRRNVLEQTGGPFGAAVFERASGRLVAPGVNIVLAGNTSLAHAEATAFMLAQQGLGDFRPRCLRDAGDGTRGVFAALYPVLWHDLVVGREPTRVSEPDRRMWKRSQALQKAHSRKDWVGLLERRKPPLIPVEVQQDVLREEACSVLELYRESGGFIYKRRI